MKMDENELMNMLAMLFGSPNFEAMDEKTNIILETLSGLNIIETQTVLCSVIDTVSETVGMDKVEFAETIKSAVEMRASIG